jgi:uncharacterized protein (DUF952 family)
MALAIDIDALDGPWRYDTPASPYPHIYGSIARDAIRGVRRVDRDAEGRFVGLTAV